MKTLLLTHDLSCTITDLLTAASRYSPRQTTPQAHAVMRAAVAFTIQLAIDQPDSDPSMLRALERMLIDKLKLEES